MSRTSGLTKWPACIPRACDCSANTSSDETRPSVASREKAPPTESRHIGKVESFERKAVVVQETDVSTPRDPATRRLSSAISPACSGAAEEIDETSAGRKTPAARWLSEDEVARTVGAADEPELVGD